MTNLGKIKHYLGISFEQVILGIVIYQQDHAKSILKKFGMSNCKPASTPLLDG